MKKILLFLLFIVLLAGVFCSCVSMTDKELTAQERTNVSVAGKVTTQFTTFQVLHVPDGGNIKKKAYQELLKKAKTEYGENADVRNITLEGGFSPIEIPLLFIGTLIGNFQEITASGDVVVFGTKVAFINQQKLEAALNKTAETLIGTLRQNSSIAILNIESADISSSEYAVNELEFKLVNSRKFKIVDRRKIDQIRNEQKFQISGDVDDNSAVSIGKILGANIVITGSISGSGNTQRLYLRVLDIQTGQIIAMVREDF